MNGIAGIFVAGGRGVLRSLLADTDASSEFIPVDTAICAMIMACKKLSTCEPEAELPVFNLTVEDSQKMNIGQVFKEVQALGNVYPFVWALWWPNGGPTKNKFVHWYRTLFFQWIPAYFVDFLLLCLGQKRL
jgi:alcohol-forming fatty acyl-CoA reductase